VHSLNTKLLNMKKNKKSPFFVKFLEEQKINNPGEVKGTAGPKPTKPSLDIAYTQKYPSDGDESIVTI
jgi:Serine endopeptidase inhibitors